MLLVTGDPEARRLAARWRTRPAAGRGARPHGRQQPGRSHPRARRGGLHGPGSGGHSPRDSEEIAALLAAHGGGASDHARPRARRTGNQCGRLLPADVMPLRFGGASFVAHCRRARARDRAADRAPPWAGARHRHARRPCGVPRRAVADPRLLSNRERHRQAHQPLQTGSVGAVVTGAQARQHLLGIEVEKAPLVGTGAWNTRWRKPRPMVSASRSTCSSGSLDTIQRLAARSAGRRRASPSPPGPRRGSSPRPIARARPSGACPAGRAPGPVERPPSSRSCARCCPGRGRPARGPRRPPAVTVGVELLALPLVQMKPSPSRPASLAALGPGGCDVDRHRDLGTVVDGGALGAIILTFEGHALLAGEAAHQLDRLAQAPRRSLNGGHGMPVAGTSLRASPVPTPSSTRPGYRLPNVPIAWATIAGW